MAYKFNKSDYDKGIRPSMDDIILALPEFNAKSKDLYMATLDENPAEGKYTDEIQEATKGRFGERFREIAKEELHELHSGSNTFPLAYKLLQNFAVYTPKEKPNNLMFIDNRVLSNVYKQLTTDGARVAFWRLMFSRVPDVSREKLVFGRNVIQFSNANTHDMFRLSQALSKHLDNKDLSDAERDALRHEIVDVADEAIRAVKIWRGKLLAADPNISRKKLLRAVGEDVYWLEKLVFLIDRCVDRKLSGNLRNILFSEFDWGKDDRELMGPVEQTETLEMRLAKSESANESKIEELTDRNEELETRLAKSESANKSKIAELTARNKKLETRLAESESANESKIAELTARNEELKMRLAKSEAPNKLKIAELTAKNEELEMRLAESESANESKIAEMEKQIAELTSSNKELESELGIKDEDMKQVKDAAKKMRPGVGHRGVNNLNAVLSKITTNDR